MKAPAGTTLGGSGQWLRVSDSAGNIRRASVYPNRQQAALLRPEKTGRSQDGYYFVDR